MIVALTFLPVVTCGIAAADENVALIRRDSEARRVTIDHHSHVEAAEDIHELPVVSGDDSESMLDTSTDPCSFLGCNSHKCAWASGGVISRMKSKKACSNAIDIGKHDTTIQTLKECMNLVRTAGGSTCSGHFQL